MSRRLCWMLVPGLAVLLLAAAVSAAPQRRSITGPRIAQFKVESFTASAEEEWSWSVENQSNNSGWASEQGEADWAVLSRGSKPMPHVTLILSEAGINGMLTGGIPIRAAYDVSWVSKTEQHRPQRCSDKGPVRGSTIGVEFEPAQSNPRHPKLRSQAVTVLWPALATRFGTGTRCSAAGISLPDTWFKKVEFIGDLSKQHEIRLSASGKIPGQLKSADRCPGCTGFKGHLTYSWRATLTLEPQ